MSALLALLLAAAPAHAMVVIDEAATVREEAPPHGSIGMSTAYRISDAVPAPRSFEFRKRALHVGAAIGVHPIDHDEIYYVLSGIGVVHSDGEEQELKTGTAAWLYKGAKVGIRQTGSEPLVLIIAYPNKAASE
jgi:mannose-6-phosphate isomerase-like protein (cupin superfamily)